MCELAGIEVPRAVQGRSLVPILRDGSAVVYPSVFAGFGRHMRMIRTDRWKLIQYPHIDRWQLFDLQADPFEKTDLSQRPDHADVMSDLKGKLAQWQRSAGDPLTGPAGR